MSIFERALPALALAAAIATSPAAHAGDPELGKAKAAVCVSCHGPRGISLNVQWPNLAGQKEQYLVSALTAYRDGQRHNELMSPMAAGLSDEDIENLAAWFSSLPPDGS
jgi:cytochrome c553